MHHYHGIVVNLANLPEETCIFIDTPASGIIAYWRLQQR
jgi:hypothetical protein